MIGGDDRQFGGQRRAADVGVGVDVDLGLQPRGESRFQDAARFINRVVAVIAVDVAELSQPGFGGLRDHLVDEAVQVSLPRLVSREVVRAQEGAEDVHRLNLTQPAVDPEHGELTGGA